MTYDAVVAESAIERAGQVLVGRDFTLLFSKLHC